MRSKLSDDQIRAKIKKYQKILKNRENARIRKNISEGRWGDGVRKSHLKADRWFRLFLEGYGELVVRPADKMPGTIGPGLDDGYVHMYDRNGSFMGVCGVYWFDSNVEELHS